MEDAFERRFRGGGGVPAMIATAATVDVVAVARYANGEPDTTSASRREANTRQALPTAPEDRLSVRAIARGVSVDPAGASASTRATIARSCPLRSRADDVDAGGGVGGGVGADIVATPFRSRVFGSARWGPGGLPAVVVGCGTGRGKFRAKNVVDVDDLVLSVN
ncbi:hypothetical protein [Saccharothrix sp.]|uniref:hypothetical protein n=1 Tax=Saccharothrix sp. TaxID=1873460 RepID=UPI002811CB98|nr:hypothetical protein [Saccharothrix sp.]